MLGQSFESLFSFCRCFEPMGPPAFHGLRPLKAGAAALSLSAVYLPRCWSGKSRQGASWTRLFPKPSLPPFPARPSYLLIDSCHVLGRALADGLASCFGNFLASPSSLVSMPLRGFSPLLPRTWDIEAVSDDAKRFPPFHPCLNSVLFWLFANTAAAAFFLFLSCCKIYLDFFYLHGPNSLIL